MQAAVAERVKEGVDSELDGKRALLSAARSPPAHRRSTGAPPTCSASIFRNLQDFLPTNIQTDPDSIPAPPALAPNEVAANDAAASSPP